MSLALLTRPLETVYVAPPVDPPVDPPVAIEYVNGYAPADHSGGTPVGSISLPAQDHTTGNSIVVAVRSVNVAGGTPVAVSSVTDTAGNTYSRAGAAEVNDTSATTEVWLASGIAGHAANIVTIEFASDTQYARAMVAQYSGAVEYSASGALAIDGSPALSHSGGTVTTTAADELVFGGVFSYAVYSGALTGASGTTVQAYATTGTGTSSGIADMAAATAGDYALTIGTINSCELLIITRSFKAASGGGGSFVYAASLSAADVQAAMNSAVAGDTVVLPAGTGTWTTQVSWSAPANVKLVGAGSLSTRGGGDATNIVDSYNSSSSILSVSTDAAFAMQGITFKGGTGGAGREKWNGVVQIFGGAGNEVKVTHCHFDTTTYSASTYAASLQFDGWVYGVVAECIFDNPAGSVNNSVRMMNQGAMNGDALGVGDEAWAQPTGLGTKNAIFVEDCTLNNGAGNDSSSGGSFVFRHCNFTASGPPPCLQTHPTGSGARHRGARRFEIYSNTFTAAAAQYVSDAIWISSGTGVVWGNTAPSSAVGGGTGFKNFISGHDMRYDNGTYSQTAPPNGWGYSGTHQTGSGSAWDGNVNTTTGYPALDQIGRGQGQRLVNDFPTAKNNVTGTVAWPNQALEPVYEWANAWSPVPSSPAALWAQNEPCSVQNRDYYCGTNDSGDAITFTGATGVGVGLLSARPSSGLTAGVGYWATDTQTLYVATGATTWAVKYQPYTYPHPLRS